MAQQEIRSVNFNLDKLCGVKNKQVELQELAWLGDMPLSLEQSCVICANNPKQILFEPCNHLCLCEACAKIIPEKKCPICRKIYNREKKVFW